MKLEFGSKFSFAKITIKEDSVMVGISIRRINSFKSLWKLYVAYPVTTTVHHKAHSFLYSLRVIDIMVTIQIEYEWSVGQYCRSSNHGIHGSSLLVVVIPWPLFSRDICKHWQPNVNPGEVQSFLVRMTHHRFIFRDLTHHLHCHKLYMYV